MSLTSRLLAGFTLIASIGFWLMLDKVLDRVERQYLEAAEEPMVDMANVLAEWLEFQWRQSHALNTSGLEAAFRGAKAREFFAKIYSVAKTRVDMDAYVTDAQGNVLYDSLHPETVGEKREARDIMLTLDGRYGARSTRENEADPSSSIMFVAAPIQGNGETLGVVSVAKPQRSTFAFRDETKWWLTRTIGSLTLCMVLGSFLLARWTTRPIRRLTDYARAITRGERPPVPKLHGSEMKTLADAFEKMRDSLEDRESVEQYVQTLTHELKSPVAAIRGASELLQERTMPESRRGQFLGNIQSESLRLQDLLDRLLALTAIEKQKTLDEPCDLDFSALAYAVCEQFGPVCEHRSLKLEAAIADHVMVWGDSFLLQTALANLVQNAVDFSSAGGVIAVRLQIVGDGACFVVEDQGPGLPDYAKGRVFERFYSLPRPSNGKKSSGLGLCFVREAALLHRGVATIENQDGNRGVRAVFILPLESSRALSETKLPLAQRTPRGTIRSA